MAVAAMVAWRVVQPRGYRQVQRMAVYDTTLIPCITGYLLRPTAGQYAFYDWRGRETWRVTVPATSMRRIAGTSEMVMLSFPPNATISSAGDTLAVTAPEDSGMRVMVWRNGILRSNRVYAEFLFTTRSTVQALDTGRIIVTGLGADRSMTRVLLVLDDRGIVARHTFPTNDGVTLSPNGASAIVGGFTPAYYPKLRIVGEHITLSPAITPAPGFTRNYAWFFADGTLVTPRGDMLRPDGSLPTNLGWRCESLAPGNRYALQTRAHETRVYSPLSGDVWLVTVPGRNDGGDATADGRFALVTYSMPIARVLLEAAARFPRLQNMIPGDQQFLALYERPGRLIARKRVNEWNQETGSNQVIERVWFPSTDGRDIITTVQHENGKCECLLYRY